MDRNNMDENEVWITYGTIVRCPITKVREIRKFIKEQGGVICFDDTTTERFKLIKILEPSPSGGTNGNH